MARFASFDEAVEITLEAERVSVSSLGRALGTTPASAAMLLQRLQEEGHVEPAGQDGWHPVAGRGERRRWARGNGASASLNGRLAMLEAENAALRHSLQEAEFRTFGSAEARQAAHPNESLDERSQQARRRLRHMLARALHPDLAPGTAEERVLYVELFKRLWPRIEAALDGRDEPEEPS